MRIVRRACPGRHGDRLAIGRTAYRFAVIQNTVKPSPVDLDEDTRMAKREASRITNFPNELIERFARISAIGNYRTCASALHMSAFAARADILKCKGDMWLHRTKAR